MIKSYVYKNITWVDVQSPDREELKKLSETHDLDPRITHEVFTPSPISEVRQFDDTIFAVFHFPVYKQTHSDHEEHTQEIDFIIGKDFIISIRYDSNDALHRFTRKLEVDSITRSGSSKDITGMHMFHSIVSELQKSTVEELRHLNDKIVTIQKQLDRSEEERLITDISLLGRTLLEFQNALMMHKDTYERLTPIAESLSEEVGYTLMLDIRKNHHKIANEVTHYRRIATELRETHLSLLNARQNEIMKKLTVLAFLTFPTTVIAAIFSMTATNTPLVGHPNDFWIIVAIMGILTASAYIYFIVRRWL